MENFSFYLQLGVEHIINLNAYDHLLFVLALCAGNERFKSLLWWVSAFTIGHSTTLVLSSLNIVNFPSAWVETLIPITILITAMLNILKAQLGTEKPYSLYAKAVGAFGFGLIHGLGFSSYLKSMILNTATFVWDLAAFNIGIEIGQILIIFTFLLISSILVNKLRINQDRWYFFVNIFIILCSLQVLFNVLNGIIKSE